MDAKASLPERRIVTPVTWLFAPDWLTLEEACELSGWDNATMQQVIDEDGVDLNNAGLIERDSLYEFQETLVELQHWDE